MYITIQNILLIGSILLFLGIVAGQSSYKFGVPTLIFFLAIGMLAGSEGIGGIVFDNVATSKFIGIVALNFILFSGGMDTKWRSIKPIFWQGVSLSTLGVILTAFAVGWFVYLISDFSFLEGLLLGSIVASTDAAAVFSILRSNNLSLRNNLKPTLEMESGSNDPVAYLLMILFLNLLTDPGSSPWYFIPKFLLQIGLGALMGYIMGKITTLSVNKIKTGYTGLYPVLVVALMLFTYSFTDKLGGNGFLSVYIAAVYFGNQKTVHREIINSTLDGFAWLMQIVLFLTLGLQVFPTHVWAILGIG
ncbi:MAG: potassium/proton antiporter, partial [Bacteroidales bacterium]